MAGKQGHRGFGHTRRLPSKRWQASYIGPDLARHNAPDTFDTRDDAEAWLSTERVLIGTGTWTTPAQRRADAHHGVPLTLRIFAEDWLANRKLKPRTADHYRKLLDAHILPGLGDEAVDEIEPTTVRSWHATTAIGTPTLRAHSYSLLRTILNSAVADRLIVANPCTMRGAGNAGRASKTEPATLDELAIIVETVPARYKLMVLLAAWCALRFGELTELRGRDVDTKRGIVHVKRAVVWVDGTAVVGPPKSDAGMRDVAIPPHLLPTVKAHLRDHDVTRDALLFPAAHDPHMRPATLYRVWYPAREAAGRDDLRFHDLRHTGAVLAASTGATLAELMARLGHSTPGAAMRYQHAAKGRDKEIAALLSKLVGGTS
jgi:integrase